MKLNMSSQGGLADEFASMGGGNVLSALILPHDPVLPLEAATKQYVDNSYLNLNANNLITGTLATSKLPGMNGDLTSSPGSGVLSLSDTGVTPGSYPKVTINIKGRITNGFMLVNSDIPNLDWSKITVGKPTTLSGYGITNGITTAGGTLTDYLSISSTVQSSTQLSNKAYITTVAGTISGVTVGDVIANVDPATPVGFLRCNGAELDKTAYSSLYAVIGERYTTVNEAGSGQPWRQQYQINDLSTPDIQYWTTGNNLPVIFARTQAIVTKNRVYLLGGHNGTSYVSTIYTAGINADGTLGSWIEDISLPGALGLSQAIVTKNRVHLIGGVNSSNTASSIVYTAAINADGTLGAWGTGTSLPGTLCTTQAIIIKNNVYLLGGATGDSTINTSVVYIAPINSDGTLGAWVTYTSLPEPIRALTAIVTKNRVYICGGTNSSVTAVSTVYTAVINSDGTLGTWITSTSLPSTLAIPQTIVTKNRVYLLGGQDTINNVSTVYSAPINTDGTLGTWEVGTSLPVSVRTTQVIVTKNRIYLLGGIGNSGLLSTVYTAPFNGGLNDYSQFYAVDNSVNYMEAGSGKPWQQQYQINLTQTDDITGWITDSSVLPSPVHGASVVVTKNRVYLLGGFNSVALSTVYTAPINTDGTLGTWVSDTSLPVALQSASAITICNKVYLIGGSNTAFVGLNSVYVSTINSDGTLGTWSSYGTLPGSTHSPAVIVTKNRIHVIGGYHNGAISTVYSAVVNIDGSIGVWSTGTALPITLYQCSTLVTKNRVYLIGGNNGTSARSTVYTAFINNDGTLSSWTADTSLPGALSGSSCFVSKNRVYVFCGHNGTTYVSTAYTAPINADGTLGTWVAATSTPGVVISAQAFATLNKLYILAGNNGTNPLSTIYSAPLLEGLNDYSPYYAEDTTNYMMPGSGRPWEQQYQINQTQTDSISSWTSATSLPHTLTNSNAIVTKNTAYLIGGVKSGAGTTDVLASSINADGTLGTWSVVSSLPINFVAHQSFVYKNKIFLLSNLNVYSNTININGTFGSWVAETNLPVQLQYGKAIVTKNRVYLLGCYVNGAYSSLTYTASINDNGVLGTWSTGPAFPVTSCSYGIAITKNRIYAFGGFGYGGNVANNLIYTSAITQDGYLSEWISSGTIPGALTCPQIFATKNRIYVIGGFSGNTTATSAVYSVNINDNGSLGTWTTDSSLPGVLGYSSLIVTKNRIYVLGGNVSGSNVATSVVYTATILEGLNDYSPYYDGTIVPIEPSYPAGYIIPSSVFKIPDHSLSDTSLNYFIKY
jgi:N-acetylneuraminic acid mutarotase